jgi:hypothetical protein
MMLWTLPYILLVAGLFASMALFLSVKREMRISTIRSRKRLEELAQRLEETSAREPAPVFMQAPRSGFNISKRVQAMRMVRRREDMSHISAALGVPLKEVELLIHVQKMSSGAH